MGEVRTAFNILIMKLQRKGPLRRRMRKLKSSMNVNLKKL